mmetsp:Transcript_21809/g.48790  ORF Transcript_21809/g.48790 Transcript_21809/m.48790 type:complete len:421 (-) Transcript_21809:57-1319(-)
MYGTPSAANHGADPMDQYATNSRYHSPLVATDTFGSGGIVAEVDAVQNSHRLPRGDSETIPRASSNEGSDGGTKTLSRSSSSYEKFERHEVHHEVHVQHTDPANDAVIGTPASLSTNITPSRFQFTCDTRAPRELATMQEEAQRRKVHFAAQVDHLSQRAKSWNVRLEHEVLDREADFEEVVEKSINQPMDDAAKRVLARLERKMGHTKILGVDKKILAAAVGDPIESESDDASNENIVIKDEKEEENDTSNEGDKEEKKTVSHPTVLELEHNQNEVYKKLAHYQMDVYEARVAHLDRNIATINHEVRPELRLETIKADQREGAVFRKFKAIAGDALASHAEENAIRVAKLELLRRDKEEKAEEKPKDAEAILADIRALRQLLEDEREERQRADEKILATIVETRKAWQKIVLESLGGNE